MKRENILINEDYTTKRVVATKFTAPGDAPAFDCSIHFGEESDDVTLQNCIIQANSLVKCSPDDTYDFETGALIALMKMCGVEKVKKAAKETFFDVAENSVNEYEEKIHALEEEIKRLKEKNAELLGEKSHLKYIKSCNESTIESLENTRDLLINKNNELIEENKELHKNIDELFENDTYRKSEVGRLCFEKHRLEEENKMLCGKIKFLDKENRNLIYGGRQNGKQYKALVELFKKLPQDKVDAAYKEAYNTTLPVWQKEVLNQMYGVYKESKEKAKFTWELKVATKREKMWNDIRNSEDGSCVEVNRGDVIDFLKDLEKEMPNVRWATGDKPSSIKPMFNPRYNPDYDKIYFFIDGNYVTYGLSKDTSRGLFQHVIYLPPMRWDLFKKGRLIVKVDSDNYEDFYNTCEIEIGRKPLKACEGIFTVYYKRGTFHIRPYKDDIPFAKKIVNWEDVR